MFARTSFICFIACQAFMQIHAQDIAQIACSPKMQSMTKGVPVFTSPGSANVIEYLSCGQQIRLLGNESGFAKVQFGERVGYVIQEYVVIRTENIAPAQIKPFENQKTQAAANRQEQKGLDEEKEAAKPQPPSSIDASTLRSRIDLNAAIAYGSQFKSRKQFLEKGLKNNKVQLASAWAMDGISKYVTFFTDFEAVASAAANAQQEMRKFTSADAAQLPLSGLVYAHVEVHGRGLLPTRKVESRYVRNSAHLVIQFGEDIIQPLSKELLDVRDASFAAPVALFTWWDVGNVSLLTGGTLGWDGAKVELEFVFRLTPEQMRQKGTAVLIDADGNRHKEQVDFGRIVKMP